LSPRIWPPGSPPTPKGLPGAAAGTFLEGVTFLALGVAGLGGVIAPMRVELPARFAIWTAFSPLPLLAFAIDGRISRLERGLLLGWFAVALVGLARSGRELVADEDDDDGHKSHPGVRLIVGLGVLTGGGWLLGDGLAQS
jgi:Ca2+/Na+ antiporter